MPPCPVFVASSPLYCCWNIKQRSVALQRLQARHNDGGEPQATASEGDDPHRSGRREAEGQDVDLPGSSAWLQEPQRVEDLAVQQLFK